MLNLYTLIGALVEVLGADFFTVAGLAMQKVAVMKLIENNRMHGAVEPTGSSFRAGSGAGGGYAALAEEEDEGEETETDSEIMTVFTERSMREANAINDTQVPDSFELMRNCGWLLGLIVFILGNALELFAMSLTSQTNVALLSNFTLVWNAAFSVFIFQETFHLFPPQRECSWDVLVRRWDALHCTILIVGSCVAVVFTPATPEDDMDSKDLLHRWTEPPYCYWGGFMLVTMFITSLFLVKNWRNHKTGNLNAALIAGLCGFMSAFCATLSKVATTLISKTIRGKNQFDSPEATFLCVLWVCMLVSQLALLNVGLGAFEQGLVVPIYEIVGTLATIVSGVLFYQTYQDFTTPDWIGFTTGVALMSWGVYLVAHREVHTQQELSDFLHANLSHMDDLLHLGHFERRTRSADMLDVETEPGTMEDAERSLLHTFRRAAYSEVSDVHEGRPGFTNKILQRIQGEDAQTPPGTPMRSPKAGRSPGFMNGASAATASTSDGIAAILERSRSRNGR
ncbi:Magnesium transporter NIPA2 [Hondaea fermentalgiana]|uniref:Magnesium transporter NIPA2 n=1 Tax=Hondaea fermentalgiana TaxID=2315210 RepID=A0A2R5G0X8_9STRA|nr:Magnesium transporter NIPA2 [Hondaea fermentalgiana]|eukprot:GBG24662.1 Magnesium transporter NIPA2 [Hondaea fermentalgiana]